jgi:hypothetical protein
MLYCNQLAWLSDLPLCTSVCEQSNYILIPGYCLQKYKKTSFLPQIITQNKCHQFQISVWESEYQLDQCFSTFFWMRRTIFCHESLRHTNVRDGNTAGDSGLHTHSLPSAVVISGCLLHFSTTYVCKLGFLELTNIKNKKCEWLPSLEQEMHVCLSSIRPRIELLCKKRQAQVSH